VWGGVSDAKKDVITRKEEAVRGARKNSLADKKGTFWRKKKGVSTLSAPRKEGRGEFKMPAHTMKKKKGKLCPRGKTVRHIVL